MYKIDIRVDANTTIASGHMMRCLSIADACKTLGIRPRLLVADRQGSHLYEGRGHEVKVLATDAGDLESELPMLLEEIQREKPNLLLVDSYLVTPTYMKALQEMVCVAYMDDLKADHIPCDIRINYAVGAECIPREAIAKQEVCLYGMRYTPLGMAYLELSPRKICDKVTKVLVMTGGADLQGFSLELAKCLTQQEGLQEMEITMVVGALSNHYQELCKLAMRHPNLRIVCDVRNMQDYMLAADVAISAGGTTLYELCATGTPAISYLLADNQYHNVTEFAKRDLIPYAGDIRKDCVCERILQELALYTESSALRKDRSKKMQGMISSRSTYELVETMRQATIMQ